MLLSVTLMIASVYWLRDWLAAIHDVGRQRAALLVVLWVAANLWFAYQLRDHVSELIKPITNFADAVL